MHAVFSVSTASLQGQSTFIGDAPLQQQQQQTPTTPDASVVQATIQSFEFALQEAASGLLTLLHMNCEGCEWTLVPEMVQTGFVQNISVLQIGTHNYGEVGVGTRAWQLCEMHRMLSATHDLVKWMPFGWERWVKKES